MTGLAAAQEAPLTPKSGGSGEQSRFQLSKEWRGVAVLYARDAGGVVEISALYESHIPQQIKDELAARFGIAIHEWRCSK